MFTDTEITCHPIAGNNNNPSVFCRFSFHFSSFLLFFFSSFLLFFFSSFFSFPARKVVLEINQVGKAAQGNTPNLSSSTNPSDPSCSTTTSSSASSGRRIIYTGSVADPNQDSAGGKRVWTANEKAATLIFSCKSLTTCGPEALQLIGLRDVLPQPLYSGITCNPPLCSLPRIHFLRLTVVSFPY